MMRIVPKGREKSFEMEVRDHRTWWNGLPDRVKKTPWGKQMDEMIASLEVPAPLPWEAFYTQTIKEERLPPEQMAKRMLKRIKELRD